MMKRLTIGIVLLLAVFTSAAAQSFRWWYGGDTEPEFYGLGSGTSGIAAVAIRLPYMEGLQGAKLSAVNIPVCEADMTDVEIWVRRSLNDEAYLYKQAVEATFVADKYTKVELTTPLTIDGEMYVGYTCKTSHGNAIGVADGEAEGSLYYSEDNEYFFDFADKGYGVSALQLFISDLKDYNVQFDAIPSQGTFCNQTVKIPVTVISNSNNPVSQIEYTAIVDGKPFTSTANVNIAAGIDKRGRAEIEITAIDRVAPYEVSVSITKCNGQLNQNTGSPAIINCENLLRKANRRVVMEEFTGTMCGWCTRGIVGMERLASDYADNFIGIAIHQFQSTDPMYLTSYAPLGFTDAPKCMLNRQEMMDPYYGKTDFTCYAIKDEVEKQMQQAAKVEVKVKGTWTSESRSQVKAEADVEFLGSTGNYTIAYVLLGNDIGSTSSSWQQQNFHYEFFVDELGIPADDPLAAFCKGGENGKKYVTMRYNDVAIGSSYAGTENKATALPEIFTAGDKISNDYTLSLPAKTLLKNALNKDEIYVVALVIDENGFIVNADRAKVIAEGDVDGISVIERDSDFDNQHAAIYNLNGQRLANPLKGIVIRNGKKIIQR